MEASVGPKRKGGSVEESSAVCEDNGEDFRII